MLFKCSGKYIDIYFSFKITFLCLAPWSPLGALTLECFVRLPSGWTVDCPIVNVFGERLTGGLVALCAIDALWAVSPGLLGDQVLWLSAFSCGLAEIPSYLLCGLRSRLLRSPASCTAVPGLWPFSLLLCSTVL